MSDIHRCCIAYIAFLNHSCVTVCNLKLKDEEAEIKLTGSVLEEEANMAEIEEDKGDARIWLPNIDGFFTPLVDY